MMVCLETDVLIDCLRGTPESRVWLTKQSRQDFGVPGIVAMELVMGCQNQADLARTRKFINSFALLWHEAHECKRAYDLLTAYRLTSGLSIPDCLIAAMALERSLRLYTFNLKHYHVISGLDVQEPYQRAQK